jgi:uncharacterized membrane protein YoaK (UPF0700 family)
MPLQAHKGGEIGSSSASLSSSLSFKAPLPSCCNSTTVITCGHEQYGKRRNHHPPVSRGARWHHRHCPLSLCLSLHSSCCSSLRSTHPATPSPNHLTLSSEPKDSSASPFAAAGSAASNVKPHAPDEVLRYWLFLLLEFSSGVVEAFAYSSLGHIFCAYITGSMVILGVNLADPSDPGAFIAPALIAVCGFCCGSWTAGRIRAFFPKADTLRPAQALLLAELLLLLPSTAVAATVDLSEQRGQYVTIILTALAMSHQMAAQVTLAVNDLPSPLATTVVHKMMVDNPFRRGNRRRSVRPVSQVLALIAGGVVGSELGIRWEPWAAEMLGCILCSIVIVALEVMQRRPHTLSLSNT